MEVLLEKELLSSYYKEAFGKPSLALDMPVSYTKQPVAAIMMTLIAASGFVIFFYTHSCPGTVHFSSSISGYNKKMIKS